MGTSSKNPDSGPGTEDEYGEDSGNGVDASGHSAQEDRQSNPGDRAQRNVISEKTTKRSEMRRETITSKGIHEMSLAINSLDDHFQAGLQELRNSLAGLQQERTTINERLHTVSEKLFEVTAERDKYQHAVTELQQEVVDARQQLSNEQNKNAVLRKKIQEMGSENESHMYSIAMQFRDRQLAHRSIVKWRKKVMERGRYSMVRLLEDENSQLRAELLKCQEAAKQAFLRSANVLNSEAITMFQDAATRRLGYDGSLEGGRSSSPNPPSSSSSSTPPSPEPNLPPEIGGGRIRGGGGGVGEEEWERRRRVSDDGGGGGGGVGRGDESVERVRSSRGSIHVRGPHDHSPEAHTTSQESLESEERGGDTSYPRGLPGGDPGGYGGQGAVPRRGRVSPYYAPDTLREEARAKLSQLQGRQRMQEASNPPRPAKTTLTSRHNSVPNLGPRTAACRCRAPPAAAAVDPYRCPYCTPINNSSFGHAKEAPPAKKKAAPPPDGGSNVARSAILTNMRGGAPTSHLPQEGKKVIYRPSASTVVIEKHLKN